MRKRARMYFNQTGLKYSDINEGDILVLCILLQKELKGDKHAVSVNMRLSQMIEATYRHCGQLVECSIFVNSHYFKNRECITFNPDGFIGFCGWADEKNAVPIVEAFKRWCDYLVECREEALWKINHY